MATQILNNKVLWVSVFSWFIAQLIKILVNLIKCSKWDFRLIISSGGMPSSHSSFVTAMSVSLGLEYGFDSPLFAISAIVSLVVMYDAAGVRRAAGQQAALLNKIMDEIISNTLNVDKRLKELLGHTPIEVAAGAVLGTAVALLFY